MSGTFLIHDFNSPPPPPFQGNVVSGTTTDPGECRVMELTGYCWRYHAADEQPGSDELSETADQPWLLVNRDPVTATQDNVYVAYDDFGTQPAWYADRGLLWGQSTQLHG